jgi:hypothetical protein
MHLPARRRSAAAIVAATSTIALAIAGITSTTSSASAADRDRVIRGLSLTDTQPSLAGRESSDKAPTSALAETSPGLKNIASPKRIPVMIKYDYDAVATYSGSVSGLAATSPSVTDRSLTKTRVADSDYLGYVKSQEAEITSRIQAKVPAAEVTTRYRVVYGGVAAIVPGNKIRSILSVPGVVAVQRDAVNHPLTDASPAFINATTAYNQLHTTRNAGRGILLGNLDTGVWPEHPAFADQGNLPPYSGPAIPCNFGDNPLTPAVDPFVCNKKLVGGRKFMNTYDSINGQDYPYNSARDSEGHGSHTASTSAGNVLTNVQTLGPVLARINGIAPGAQIAEYRVCGPQGCYDSDTTQAAEQAILDGVDVINFSISGGTQPMSDPTELAFLDAYAAGVFVATSAGNDGPGAGTANHLSPWVMSVAASTQSREFASTLTLNASGGDTFTVDGASITAGAGPLPVVESADPPYSDALCANPAAPGTFTGKIVVCVRGGGIARVTKGFNVLQGGASGMILVNPSLADVETDNHWLPAIHVADGTALQAFMAGHSGVTGSFTAGAARNGQGDVMAAFSSRGPAGNFIKPDITAPGVQILAAMTPTPDDPVNGPPGEYYQAIAGTSMASPHIAGAAILLRALHPSWTPGQIKSAIMTQARTAVVKEDLTTPADPFDMGAGRIDVGRASNAPVTISETAARFAALAGDPDHAIDLNIPSINAPTMPGRITTQRTIKNVTNGKLQVTMGATVPANTRITFSPTRLTLPQGGSGTVNITIDSTAPLNSQQFASVRFVTGKGTARIPVAFVPKQGSVSLTQGCDAASVQLNASTVCTVSATNNSFEDQDVDLTTSVNNRLRITGATGATLSNGRALASATLGAATLGVPSVDPGTSPGGFIPLALFGITPIAIGDEDILNFNVPPYSYNGVTENAIGVDSNGYSIAGGGSSEDNNCCNLPTAASSERPNDLLASFWTDLDGTGAPGIYAGTLTDGVNTWLVLEWQVNVFGTTSNRHFQQWIGVDGTQDISFTYDPGALPADPNGQDFLVGAENSAGDGDVSSFLPTQDLVVTSTDPTPGDTLTYQVTVRGIRTGAGNVHTDMDATGVNGTTTANTPVSVTP